MKKKKKLLENSSPACLDYVFLFCTCWDSFQKTRNSPPPSEAINIVLFKADSVLFKSNTIWIGIELASYCVFPLILLCLNSQGLIGTSLKNLVFFEL